MRLAMLVIGIIGCCTHCLGPARAETTTERAETSTEQNQQRKERHGQDGTATRHRASDQREQRRERQQHAGLHLGRIPDELPVGIREGNRAARGMVRSEDGAGWEQRTTTERSAVDLVCTVAHALKQPWPVDRCQAVAAALATTREPKTMLAVAVLESDMRPTKRHLRNGPKVADVGLLGVACRLRHGRCTNWPVRGLTVAALQDPRTNIMAAARVLAKKRARCGARALDCYAGDPDGSSGRTGDVRALVAAFAGVELQVKKARVRELVRKIAAAVRRGARS
jgi:hypothetical protein